MDKKIVFIGAGNMAEALVSGMVKSELCDPKNITLIDIRPDRLAELKEKYGISVSEDNNVVKEAKIVLFAVKPQVMADVLEQTAPNLNKETLVISIAAGIKCEKIETAFGGAQRVVRVMPNTPALVGAGTAGIAKGISATDADLKTTETILNCVGISEVVDENHIDAVTALSGSGPAYVFYMLEAMLSAAEQMGLDEKVSRILALQTIEGSARLMKDSKCSAKELRERVTSKGGTTAAAIKVLDDLSVKGAIFDAVLAAEMRSKELSDESRA